MGKSKSSSKATEKKEETSAAPALPLPCFQAVTGSSTCVYLKILAKPGAKQNGITDIGDELGVQVAAPPVDGAANDELKDFIVSVLSLRKSQVSIAKGMTSRNKVLLIDDIVVPSASTTSGKGISASSSSTKKAEGKTTIQDIAELLKKAAKQ